jgi:hypothetical protein
METIVVLLAALIIVGLLCYAIEKAPAPLAGPVKAWIEVLIVLVGAVYLVQRFLI